LGKTLQILGFENKHKTVFLGKYWVVLTPLNFSQIHLYLGHDLPKEGKILGKELCGFTGLNQI